MQIQSILLKASMLPIRLLSWIGCCLLRCRGDNLYPFQWQPLLEPTKAAPGLKFLQQARDFVVAF